MASSSKDLGTPQCSAEERAWLLIFQKRSRGRRRLSDAFNEQFAKREHRDIMRHAVRVRDCSSEIQSQLLELAKQFRWYKDMPQEGERDYKQMKRLERKEEAKARRAQNKRDFEAQKRGKEEMQGSEGQDTRAGIDNIETPARTDGTPQESEAARASLAG